MIGAVRLESLLSGELALARLPEKQKERNIHLSNQGLLYTWTDSLGTFFATFVIIKISVNDTNTICRSSKSITFPKIWRVWLKN